MEENIEELLKLIEDKKINELQQKLEEMNSADFPMLFEKIEDKKFILIYRLLSKEKASEVFAELDSDIQEKLINYLSDSELKNMMEQLYMDDAADLIEEMPATVVKRILKNIKPENRKIINELLDYPEDSAGSIMTVEYVDLKENLTVQEALDRIKKIGLKKETIYNCYVTNMQRKLLGAIELKDLVIAERTDIIKNIMDTNIKKITTITDKEEVAKMFDKYHLLALPVVDKEDRLVGIITVDDAIDVMQDEVSEDFEKMAAMQPNEDNYFKTSVFKHSKNRIIWLLFLMLTSIITGTIITNYENAFATVPILVAFIPMLMDTGGNCGSQSSTLVIRGLAMDEIRTRDFIKVWWKEFRVSLIVGITLAVVNGIRILIQYRDYQLSLVVGLTLIFTVSIAKSLGCILPILAKKLKMDPAIMASPLITTIVDTCSVLVFFNVAVLIMKI
jgi:magnesium transporter